MSERRQIPSVDLLNESADWGLTVCEATARKTARTRALMLGGYALFGVAAVLVLPIVAGMLLFEATSGVLVQFAIVTFCVVVGMAFKFQADKSPRNAIQIDYRASEVRLGRQKKDGTFIREKVVPFRDIEGVHVDHADPDHPALCMALRGSILTMGFHQTGIESVEKLASKIAAARESARRAPIRTRIQSTMHSFEASVREVRTRVVSKLAHA